MLSIISIDSVQNILTLEDWAAHNCFGNVQWRSQPKILGGATNLGGAKYLILVEYHYFA